MLNELGNAPSFKFLEFVNDWRVIFLIVCYDSPEQQPGL